MVGGFVFYPYNLETIANGMLKEVKEEVVMCDTCESVFIYHWKLISECEGHKLWDLDRMEPIEDFDSKSYRRNCMPEIEELIDRCDYCLEGEE